MQVSMGDINRQPLVAQWFPQGAAGVLGVGQGQRGSEGLRTVGRHGYPSHQRVKKHIFKTS